MIGLSEVQFDVISLPHMISSQEYVARPPSKNSPVKLEEFFRVYLSPTALQRRNLKPGKEVLLLETGDVKGAVIVWLASQNSEKEKIKDTEVQISKPLQELYDIKIGSKITLSELNESVEDCIRINLQEVPQANSSTQSSTLNEVNRPHWTYLLEQMFHKAEYICPGVTLEKVEFGGERKTFKVDEVNSSSVRTLYRIQQRAKITINVPPLDGRPTSCSSKHLYISNEGIGGLQKQLDQLNEILTDYSADDEIFIDPPDDEPSRGGVILHGLTGTGKSAILQNLARAGWRKVFRVDTPLDHRSITRIFDDAHRNQPSLVIIDRIDTLAGKRNLYNDETVANIAPSLCREFDRIGSARILVVATTRSLQNVDETLRIPACFDYEIEIPVPSSKARAEILKVLYRQTKNIDDKILEALAERTHGFVGADLQTLKKRAKKKAKARLLEYHLTEGVVRGNTGSEAKAKITIEVLATDFDAALLEVRPTAMREVFLQTPNVKWSDIGGQDEVKKAFAQAIEWPIKVFRHSSHLP